MSSTATTDFPNLANTVHDSTDLNHEARLVIGKQPRSCCDYVCDDSRVCRVTRLSGYTCCITAGCGECIAAGCGYVTCNHYFSFGSCGCSASLRCSDMVLLGIPPIADNILLLLPCLFPCLFPCLLIDAGRMCVDTIKWCCKTEKDFEESGLEQLNFEQSKINEVIYENALKDDPIPPNIALSMIPSKQKECEKMEVVGADAKFFKSAKEKRSSDELTLPRDISADSAHEEQSVGYDL